MRALLPILLLSLFSGCYFELPGSGADGDDAPISGYAGYERAIELDVSNASLSGSLGDVRGTSEFARIDSPWNTDREIYVDLRADVPDGVIMNGLTIEGGLDLLQPGVSFTSSYDDYYSDTNGLYASVIGCSGPEDNWWQYDRMAERVTVEVEPGPTPDSVEVNYEAEFPDGSSVLGSLTIVH
ncbi:MAG: hypothetical protein AAF411_20815 [Myxococcota bacterium]